MGDTDSVSLGYGWDGCSEVQKYILYESEMKEGIVVDVKK